MFGLVTGRMVAILAIGFILSASLNFVQLWLHGKAMELCDKRLAQLEQSMYAQAAERDSEALEVARAHRQELDKLLNEIEVLSNGRIERVRTITRTMPVPSGCTLPDSVQAAIREATASANRRVRAGAE